MTEFEIVEMPLGNGTIGITRLPGAKGDYSIGMAAWKDWNPDAVLTMNGHAEMDSLGAKELPLDLARADIQWLHFPVKDFGVAEKDKEVVWLPISQTIHRVLNDGGRVIVHCRGGCGRTGMAVLRLMVELGEEFEDALERLRGYRPCAVETNAQLAWARDAAPVSRG